MARRRLTTSSEEWSDEDAGFKYAAVIEEEDRRISQFPHDTVQRIPDFYRGKDIFITGVTGFLGKVLLEKLMRSLPEGGRIFLLMRSKRNQTTQERLKKILEVALFKEIMTENPKAAERLVVVEGDCGAIGLNLSQADRQLLIDNVSIVFHCAAVVRFNSTNTDVILTNTRGTREVVNLCKEMKKLAAFVHVSTAFCNATVERRMVKIPEEVLSQGFDWRTAIAIAERPERDTRAFDLLLNKVAPSHFINYTFSKGLSECLIEEECQDIPTIIVRPSVVIATYEDPFGGWVDNLYGPMSVWDGIGQGVIRSIYGREDNVLDYVPVDMCVKSIIAAAWHRGLGFRTSPDPKKVDVIGATIGDVSRNTFGILHEKMQILFDRHSHRYVVRYPRLHITESFWLYWFIVIFSHVPAGVLVDLLLRLYGKKPMLMTIYRRLHFANVGILKPFQTYTFLFENKCNWQIQARVRKEDRDLFYIPSKTFTMDYYHDNIRGIIEHCFNEKAYSVDQNNRHIMYYVDWIQNVLLFVLGVWILRSLFPW